MKKRLLAMLLAFLCLAGCGSASASLFVSKHYQTDILDFWKNSKDEYSARHKIKSDDMLIDVRLANSSTFQTVDAIDVAIYCTDAYDEIICPADEEDGYIRYFTTDTKIKPGKNAYIGYCRMDGCKRAKEYSIAIVRYHIKDGSTVNLANTSYTDPVSQYHWITWDLR